MKFIKVYQQNQNDFFLINIESICYVQVEKSLGRCRIFLANGEAFTMINEGAKQLLIELSNHSLPLFGNYQAHTSTQEEF